MHDNLLNSGEKPEPVWKRNLRRTARCLQIWYRNLFYLLIEIILLGTATIAIFGTALLFIKVLWHLYLQTPIGRKYVLDISLLTKHTLAGLLDRNLFWFSFEITATTLITGLIISAICQVLAVRRFFYEGRGLPNRMAWVLLFSAASAYSLFNTLQMELPVAFVLSILPSMCLFASCMAFSAKLLPEFNPIGIVKMARRL